MQPQITFSTSRSEQEPSVQAWGHFRNHIRSMHHMLDTSPEVVGATPATANRGVATFWRLIATNHRELARSYFLYSSFNSARNHLSQILEMIDDLSIVTLRGSEQRTHGWYATVGGTPIVTCSRWYSGSAAATQAAMGAMQMLPFANVVDSVRPLGVRPAAGARSYNPSSLDPISS